MLSIRKRYIPDAAARLGEGLSRAARCSSRNEVFDEALRFLPGHGLVCEFGVFEGNSTNYLARSMPGRTLFGFDSFEGLPESWRPGFDAGMFSTGKRAPAVPPNVILVRGWFDETLPTFVAEHRGPVAMLHIDCDLYSSTRCVLDHLGDRLVPGSILVFDEFFNYPGWEEHEFRAFSEFVAERGLPHEYIAYNDAHEQVAIRITK